MSSETRAFLRPFCVRRVTSECRRRRSSVPGAPMMPPPGCVADPHIQRLRIGVLYCAQPGTGRAKNSCSSVSSPWKMLPSVSPNSRSRSSGVSTCRCRMMSRMFGAYSAIVSITVSPNASRCSSQRAGCQLVRRVLHEARQDVFARRRDRRIGERRDHHVDVRPPRELAVLRLVVGALHVVDARRDRDRAAQVRPLARQAREIRQRVEREVHLARRSAELVAAHLVEKFSRQLLAGR